MSDVFSSRIKKELDYDFLFNDNLLDQRDEGVEERTNHEYNVFDFKGYY